MSTRDELSELETTAIRIIEVLRSKGFEALFAGGCVRDRLMERIPKDIDIATNALPAQVQEIFPKAVPVGAQFGVVIVVSNNLCFEVATFRKDGDYSDGRHPDGVTFSSPREDACRRDFTINGLFYDPLKGKILDFVGGRRDLEKKLIRTIGEPSKRFQEDKLRLIRAIRFSVNLGFAIEEETGKAVRRLAGTILEVSWERIRDELCKILVGPKPNEGIRLLYESGLLNHILPEIAALAGVAQPEQFHPEGDVFTHTLLMLEGMKNPTITLALGVLLHDVGKPETFTVTDRIRFHGHVTSGVRLADKILRRLRLSRVEREGVKDLIRYHMHFLNIQQMKVSKMKRFLMRADFPEHLELHRLDCLCSHKNLENWEFCKEKYEEISKEPRPLPPIIQGRDLIEMGYIPGPVFSQILTGVEDARLEGELSTREQAIEYVNKNFPLK